MTEQTAIVTVQPSTTFLAPAASLTQLRDRYQIFNQFVKDTLHPGVDFQVIPGTDKPSLVKPGAEKLAALFGLSARFSSVTRIEDWTGEEHGGEPLFYYVYNCELSRGDLFVASCEGSCNSREKKYRYRNADRVCPNCGKPAIFKSKNKPEFYCWAKKGGCGATFQLSDKRITEQETGQVINPDIADVINTLQKMAQKRAFVGAVLIATNASEYFTQDVEDMPGFGFVEGDFVDTPKQSAPVVTKPAPQPAPVQPTPVAPAPAGKMSLEMALTETNSEGEKYGDIATDKLSHMANAMQKKMRDNGITEEQHTEYQRKCDAIAVILANRNSGQ